MSTEAPGGRRILSAVLPQLHLALGQRRWIETGAASDGAPLVVLDARTDTVVAADAKAIAAGVRPHQSSTAASTVAAVRFASIEPADVVVELDHVAEHLSPLAPTVAVALEQVVQVEAPALPDTVWLDVTGACHLWGGERGTIEAARARIEVASGQRNAYGACIAIASGPRIAVALARGAASKGQTAIIATPRDERAQLDALSLATLPMPPPVRAYLTRLGVSTLGALAQLPRGQVSARLSADARALLGLLEGRDTTPLMAWAPPRLLVEAQRYEEPIEDRQALLFVARGMTARLGARLSARGEATGSLELRLSFDRRMLLLSHGPDAPAQAALSVGLPVPLEDGEALLRTLMPVIERAELPAPVTAVELEAKGIVRAQRSQLDLGGGRRIDPTRLPRLMAELSAQLGPGRVGVMEERDAHRLEKRCVVTLAPLNGSPSSGERPTIEGAPSTVALAPSRLLPEPLPIGRCAVGEQVKVGGQRHTVEAIETVLRMDGVEWWTTPVSREYLRVTLLLPSSGERSEALVFREPRTERTFLHGWFE